MARSIKFRAWNELTKEMYYDAFRVEQRDGYVAGISGQPMYCKFTDFMQYTGLKDKNGKEIYEGDLIVGVYGRVVDNPHWKANGVGLIEWRPFGNLAGFQTKNPHIDIFDEKTVEVIGNIHEHPELVKK